MRHIFVKQGFSVLVITMMAVMGAPRSETRETRHPAVKVLCIPAPAFEMQTNDVKYTNTGVLSLNDGWGYVRAPLILPNNTKIKKVEMVCKDNGSLNLRMWIHTISNDLSQNFTLCEVDSSGASSTYETFSTTVISPNVINNVDYNYFLNLSLPGTKTAGYEFVSAKIYYTGAW